MGVANYDTIIVLRVYFRYFSDGGNECKGVVGGQIWGVVNGRG